MNKRQVSTAGPGEGTDDPETVFGSDITDDVSGDKTPDGRIIWWDGNEYSKDDCWMVAGPDSVANLETLR